MKTSTLLLIGGAAAIGIYFLTKGPSGKPMGPEDIANLRAEVARMTNKQVLNMSRNIKLVLAEIQANSSKYIAKYGEERFAIMLNNATMGLLIADQEIAKRHLRDNIA